MIWMFLFFCYFLNVYAIEGENFLFIQYLFAKNQEDIFVIHWTNKNCSIFQKICAWFNLFLFLCMCVCVYEVNEGHPFIAFSRPIDWTITKTKSIFWEQSKPLECYARPYSPPNNFRVQICLHSNSSFDFLSDCEQTKSKK